MNDTWGSGAIGDQSQRSPRKRECGTHTFLIYRDDADMILCPRCRIEYWTTRKKKTTRRIW